MPSPHTSSDPRKGISFCVEGWVRDQQRQTDLESKTESHRTSARHYMSDQPWTPRPLERSSSPSKRQRTSDGGSSSQWVERLSSTGLDSALPTFTEPTSSGTSASRAPSPTKSIRHRRIQLDYTNPAIYFRPPKNSHDSEEGSSDNSSRSESDERTPPILQQVSSYPWTISSPPRIPTVNKASRPRYLPWYGDCLKRRLILFFLPTLFCISAGSPQLSRSANLYLTRALQASQP